MNKSPSPSVSRVRLLLLAGTHPRLSLVVSACLMMAAFPCAGATDLGDDPLSVAMDRADIQRPAGSLSGACNHKSEMGGINRGGGKGGKLGSATPGLAVADSDSGPVSVSLCHHAAVQDSVIAQVAALVGIALLALLGYCALVSCTPATRRNSAARNTPPVPTRDVHLQPSAPEAQVEIFSGISIISADIRDNSRSVAP